MVPNLKSEIINLIDTEVFSQLMPFIIIDCHKSYIETPKNSNNNKKKLNSGVNYIF
jgi:hypothetical protein